MAERLIELLRDPEKRRAMGVNGRRRIEQHFSTANRLKRTTELYQRFLELS
jgi:glycosyltransferase involved in cell wall biosynthesis